MQTKKQQCNLLMGTTDFLLFGAGGHARVVASGVEANKASLLGVFDSNSKIETLDGVPNLGDYDPSQYPNAKVLLCVGDNQLRAKIAPTIQHAFGTLIHPSAIVDRLVTLGEGTQVIQGAIINRGTTVGKHCIINTASSIDHDCQIGDFVHIAPKATLCGAITIGEGSLIGAGATVLPNLTIGENVQVGAGAVVTKDIPSNTIVAGVPAKINVR